MKWGISQRFLALLRSSEHIRHWVQSIDIAFYHKDSSFNHGYVEAELLRLLPSLKTMIFTVGFPGRPRPWYHLHLSLRETLCDHVFPRLEHLRLSCCTSFPGSALLPARLLQSLHLRDVHHLLSPAALSDEPRLLPIVELALDRTGVEQAVSLVNTLSQVTGIDKYSPRIYSLKLSFSPQMRLLDIAPCAVLLSSLRGHLTKLQWGSIPPEVWPQFQIHSMLRLSQYPVLEHLVLNAPRDKLQAFISWLVAELLDNTDGPPVLKSLSLICDSKTYPKIDSPWSALDQLQSLEYFNALVFTWVVLPAVSTFRDIAEQLPLCCKRKLLRFIIPTQWEDDGEHIHAINQVLG
ncbi:hypothetical protein DL96DRAFT_1613342 [Flagelloscypha sp. PMI_526]|nr:hypothetical protein DL96DRAFT_1613342 [Flagelloscypha sp. PMI_526]